MRWSRAEPTRYCELECSGIRDGRGDIKSLPVQIIANSWISDPFFAYQHPHEVSANVVLRALVSTVVVNIFWVAAVGRLVLASVLELKVLILRINQIIFSEQRLDFRLHGIINQSCLYVNFQQKGFSQRCPFCFGTTIKEIIQRS